MTIKANLADGRVLTFPDGTDPQVIQSTVKRLLGLNKGRRKDDFVDPLSIKSVLSQAVSNTPKSAANFVKDLITPFLHPVETAKALASLGQGLGEKLIPGKQDNEQIVDDLAEAFKERYGGIDNIKKTLANDPVGFVADISSLLVPGGAALKGVGVATRTGKIGKAGKIVSKAAEILDPVSAAGKVTKVIASKIIPKDLPGKLYQSAAKFSTTIPEAIRATLSNTALENRIMPTLSGLDKARNKINEFNDEITKLIDTATDAGEKIPVNALFSKFGDLRKKMSGEPITRDRQITRVAKEISIFFKKKGKEKLTPKEAQELKQAIYKETEGYYNKIKNNPARVDAKQAVAQSAKESIEKIFPEIKQLNKNEGALIALIKELEKSASRISNRDLLGIGVPIKGGAGGAFGGLPGAIVGVGIGLFDTPQVKAKLAIVLNSLKKKGVVLSKDSLLAKFLDIAPGGGVATLRQSGKLEQLQENTQP